MRPQSIGTGAAISVMLLFPSGCGGDLPTDPGIAADRMIEAPDLPPPSEFAGEVDNLFFPLIPGTRFEYRSDTDEGVETTIVEVTNQTRTILGIVTTVVRDRVYLDGDLTEDTYDWYAQDGAGNVWYLGEASCEIVDDQCVSTEGSWEAGVDGARAGIQMWGDPALHQGKTYRQEFYQDVAEDIAKVVRLDVTVSVPYGTFSGCLVTMDGNLLEPGVVEHKYYCPGVGLVLEVEPRGGRSRLELQAVTHR